MVLIFSTTKLKITFEKANFVCALNIQEGRGGGKMIARK